MFQVTGDVIKQIELAHTATDGYDYMLTGGDLIQMATQRKFLTGQGMDVGNQDVYPAFRTEEELTQALQLIWKNRVDGWWNFRDDFVCREICSAEEYKEALDIPR